jgi:hypothetical protein
MSTEKKITKVGGDENLKTTNSDYTFVPSAENKSKANQFRMFAVLLWLGAIVAQVFAIRMFLSAVNSGESPINVWVIGLIVLDLVLVFAGSILWKKSNRLDPPSEKNKFLFYVQNQLGVIMAFVAFLPLIIFILTNKKVDGKSKAILGSIAGVALLIAGIGGFESNMASVEQYTEQTRQVEDLTGGTNNVFWTKSGKSYHLYNTCGYINGKRTDEIFEGTVATAFESKNISDLCDRCENQAKKAKDEIVQPVTEGETAESVVGDSIQ